ncbi:MAG TPA: A/G-specific adenine glycosylase [Terriglobales bacterium]|jgi:A/G-specific adenine glycosylase|nr:A/G-specific adenine glycosylase [Terriglobales bacterium]
MMQLAAETKSPRNKFNIAFRRNLLRWYHAHRRELPWRASRDPYHIWISEIMLQQTRVNAVLEHYRRFLTQFPTVGALAEAPLETVLAAWSGLGYYRRARMLHEAAKKVVDEHKAEFPSSAAELQALPGIGRYTAAAIASMAFDEPVAVVDGNVERVVCRVLGRAVSQQETWQTAQSWLPQQHPGDFNQAMMELGAIVCTPRAPQCLLCPITSLCATRGEGVAAKKASRQNKRDISYGFASRLGQIWLVQRPATSSLMPGMWELPEVSANQNDSKSICTVRHSITTTDYTVSVVELVVRRTMKGSWVSHSKLNAIPLTGLARKILKKLNVL